jgi:hypothetical protein
VHEPGQGLCRASQGAVVITGRGAHWRAAGVAAIIALPPTAEELRAEPVLLERSRQRGLDV